MFKIIGSEKPTSSLLESCIFPVNKICEVAMTVVCVATACVFVDRAIASRKRSVTEIDQTVSLRELGVIK